MKRIVARWKTSGKDYLNLLHDERGYTYEGRGCGGVLPPCADDADAIEWMLRPWNKGAGPVTVLRSDRPSLKRVS